MAELTGLGRRRYYDPRDRAHKLTPEKTATTRKMWLAPPVLDQGATSSCVGHSLRSWLSAGPICNKGGPDAFKLYELAQQSDEWEGQEPDYEGSSVRGGMKALQALGLVSAYKWAFTLEDVVNQLLTASPMAVGTDWHYSMFQPDRWNYIWTGGGNAGGHAWLLTGADKLKKNPDGSQGAVRAQNSWGTGFADKGRFWVSFGELEKLIKADGEAAVAVETKA
ncbi:MAG: hypothetical protein H0W86_14385 [Armatimonadetes bacterium]|nr:hypothetical protein [Armatimonadota bacterium]